MNNQRLEYCRKCNKTTIHMGHATNHLLHLLLSVLSAGLWVPIWIITTIRNEFSYACTQDENKIKNSDDISANQGKYYDLGKKLGKFYTKIAL